MTPTTRDRRVCNIVPRSLGPVEISILTVFFLLVIRLINNIP